MILKAKNKINLCIILIKTYLIINIQVKIFQEDEKFSNLLVQ